MNRLFSSCERLCLLAAPVLLMVAGVGYLSASSAVSPLMMVAGLVLLAVGVGSVPALSTVRFTAWVVAVVGTALAYPVVFQPFTTGTPAYKWLLLGMIQAVMFGMGTQLSLRDFAGVVQQPWPVIVGLIGQFTIMPTVGYSLALLFELPPEIGAGLVLIGSCSSGLASNVFTYIAKANVALSITLTAMATMLAPICTPLWVGFLGGRLLAGTEVSIDKVAMLLSIVRIVIVPTGAALLHDHMKHASPATRRTWNALAAASIMALLAVALGGWTWLAGYYEASALRFVEAALFVLGGIAFGVVYHHLATVWPQLDRWAPILSMLGILYVTGMTTAEGRSNLLLVSGSLIAAVMLHNLVGYLLGYWMARALRLDRLAARTVSIEVGLQNGGMATGLAADMGRLGTMGLAAAVFIAWMNISGSLLAAYWHHNPIREVDGDDREPHV